MDKVFWRGNDCWGRATHANLNVVLIEQRSKAPRAHVTIHERSGSEREIHNEGTRQDQGGTRPVAGRG
jgi:hypothetical protein